MEIAPIPLLDLGDIDHIGLHEAEQRVRHTTDVIAKLHDRTKCIVHTLQDRIGKQKTKIERAIERERAISFAVPVGIPETGELDKVELKTEEAMAEIEEENRHAPSENPPDHHPTFIDCRQYHWVNGNTQLV